MGGRGKADRSWSTRRTRIRSSSLSACRSSAQGQARRIRPQRQRRRSDRTEDRGPYRSIGATGRPAILAKGFDRVQAQPIWRTIRCRCVRLRWHPRRCSRACRAAEGRNRQGAPPSFEWRPRSRNCHGQGCFSATRPPSLHPSAFLGARCHRILQRGRSCQTRYRFVSG